MPGKKRRPRGRGPKRPGKGPPAGFPDRRAMEGMMQQAVAGLQGGGEDTPLGRAQAVMYRAFEERDAEQRLRLAHEALEICPDCADAYVLLAEHAAGRKEALALYEQGVAAGERALGAEAFERDAGHFWGLLETRPYLRARLGLANSLWTAGRRDEAVRHLQDMLRLNPSDNQGVRYTLAGFLLSLDRDDDLARLLQEFPDEGSATWAYTRALLAFRQQGDTIDARRLLKHARKANKHVPAYLTGTKFPPTERPGFYSPGDKNEALNYIASFLAGWKSTPGAVAWVRANVRQKPKEETQPKGPLGLVKRWLANRLPQEFDVWQADFRQSPQWVRIAGEMVRPWTVLVMTRSNDLILAHDISVDLPPAALLWDTLVKAMQHPLAGEPHRPTEIQVRADERWESLKPHAEEVGVRLEVGDELREIGGAFQEMTENVFGKPAPGLLDVPGITPEQAGSFYEAAAAFFRQAPWKRVGYESAIKVECDRFQSGPWYAVLMGQSGLTLGLALYEDPKALRRMLAGGRAAEISARRSAVTTVAFGEEWDVPVADLEAAKEHGWPLARPDAYPTVFHKERGLSLRPPLSWELELMEACLRAVPDFVARHPQGEPAREEFTVPAGPGRLTLVLSWAEE